MKQHPIYISVDIEADGPVPGLNSMLSIGAAAMVLGNRTPIATFEINLQPLPEANPDPETMEWWAKQNEAVWAHVTKDPVDPAQGMQAFANWTRSLGGIPILATFPSWDFCWIYTYFVRFLGRKGNPFGISSLDLKSMAFGMHPDIENFKDVTKSKLDRSLFDGCPPHTHKALDDAIGQGVWLVNMLARRGLSN